MAFDFRSIMSGKRKDPLAILMRGGLSVASHVYGVATSIRNRRFDRGKTAIHRCGVPVISVGNLTTGGTGKTPVVCFIAKWFRANEVRVAIVSRGYGRGENDFNDEALELHARLPDVPHVQDPDRVEAARIAVEELEAELILMDDGFQHRRLHRDLDVVLVDSTEPFGYGRLLPRGLLRESITGLERADLVILTRCDCVDSQALNKIESEIRRVNQTVPIVCSSHRPTKLLEHPDCELPLSMIDRTSIAVISAIGNPAAFHESLRRCGAVIVDTMNLPDHDAFSPETVQTIRQWINGLGDSVAMIVCTHKDLVKLCTDRLAGLPIAALVIELKIETGMQTLEKVFSGDWRDAAT